MNNSMPRFLISAAGALIAAGCSSGEVATSAQVYQASLITPTPVVKVQPTPSLLEECGGAVIEAEHDRTKVLVLALPDSKLLANGSNCARQSGVGVDFCPLDPNSEVTDADPYAGTVFVTGDCDADGVVSQHIFKVDPATQSIGQPIKSEEVQY